MCPQHHWGGVSSRTETAFRVFRSRPWRKCGSHQVLRRGDVVFSGGFGGLRTHGFRHLEMHKWVEEPRSCLDRTVWSSRTQICWRLQTAQTRGGSPLKTEQLKRSCFSGMRPLKEGFGTSLAFGSSRIDINLTKMAATTSEWCG